MVTNMDTQTLANQSNMTAAALPSSSAYWFVFTYMPPASLVGREAEMR
jgi:hypothetical protein